ncbi:UNVERIFIED_CONTAM: beta-glucosidase [Mumia flava]
MVGAAAALVAGLVAAGTASAPATTSAGTNAATTSTADAARSGPAYLDPRLPTRKRVADLLSRMTLAEKIGQMTQAERANLSDPTVVTELGLGSVLSGGGSVPEDNTPEGWADMVDTFQDAALQTRLEIPVLYGVDAVHGHANLYGATVFPHNIGLGATRDPKLVEKIAHITAEETRATGPQWNFAPCLCVARDDRWGRTYESFGESPKLVARMAVGVRGLQGREGQLDRADRVLATPKHYAGDGLTQYGTGSGDYPIDQGIAIVSRREFAELALSPYLPALQKYGAGSVMPSFSSVDWTNDGVGNPTKMTAHRGLLTGQLKRRWGFDGFVISDWEAIHQLPGDWNTQVRTAVNAGIDMAMEPASFREFITALTEEVEAGRVPMARINDAVRRILTAKFELGLFEQPYTDRRHADDIGSAQHRKVARTAVAKSQVLLKNRGSALPLRKNQRLYVAGSNADNLGNQAGGWTLTWQGGSYHEFPGTTILEGIEDASRRDDIVVSEDASEPVPRNATGVVVVGETPYAEGFGDVGGPQWAWDPGDNGVPRPVKDMKLSEADQQAVETVCSGAAQCVVIVISGRPLEIQPALLRQIDGLVAGWLPGSEGAGVADVLFGTKRFTGKLSVSWPRSVEQEPINVGDADYDPLYPYGFGLRTRGR